MSMIVVVGQFDIHPEDTQEAAELMRLMMNATFSPKERKTSLDSVRGVTFPLREVHAPIFGVEPHDVTVEPELSPVY